MAISHTDHNHPNTPAARAACRKALSNGDQVATKGGNWVSTGSMVIDRVEPIGGSRRRSPRNLTTPAASSRGLKKPGTRLRTIGDLADVPRMLAHGCRLAWDLAWEVKVGEPFNDSEANVVLFGPVGRVTLVWRVTNPEGVWVIWVRRNDSSVAHKVESIAAGIDAASTEDAWDGKSRIVGL